MSAYEIDDELAVECPAWCVRHTGEVDIDEPWVWHHSRLIEWRTFRGGVMSLALTATTDLAGKVDIDGVYLELRGDEQDGCSVGAQFGFDDVQHVIAALRDLVGLAQRTTR